jgi:pimeloyl-ACP methyl ester carboxylesterase
MPYMQSDGAKLYYEQAGSGAAIVFVHEFSGDLWSWEKQIQHFSRRYRCVAFNARGYPPSDVPAAPARYSPRHAVDDIRAVMRHLRIGKAHIMGCSMGSRSTLDFGLTYPRMAYSLSMIGLGSGADPREQKTFAQQIEARALQYEQGGLTSVLQGLRQASNRVRLKRKNPRAFDDFCRRFMQHSAQGCANITRRVQGRRPSLFSLERALRALKVPTHLIVGDEDPGALSSSLFVKQVCPAARLSVVADTGHLVNLEEPDMLHRMTEDFYALVESGQWRLRRE